MVTSSKSSLHVLGSVWGSAAGPGRRKCAVSGTELHVHVDPAGILVILLIVEFTVCVDWLSAFPSLLFPPLFPDQHIFHFLNLKLLISCTLKLPNDLSQSVPFSIF